MLGQILRKQDEPAEAVRHFELAIAANPSYKEAFFELGKSELILGRPQAALEPLRKAIELDPKYVQAHYTLGIALRKSGHPAEGSREIAISEQIQEQERAEDIKKVTAQPSPK
jgi:tetratricopeptide (TPR) repeat protein